MHHLRRLARPVLDDAEREGNNVVLRVLDPFQEAQKVRPVAAQKNARVERDLLRISAKDEVRTPGRLSPKK